MESAGNDLLRARTLDDERSNVRARIVESGHAVFRLIAISIVHSMSAMECNDDAQPDFALTMQTLQQSRSTS
jgi:hypothetical protein